jgi:hypothetical protein
MEKKTIALILSERKLHSWSILCESVVGLSAHFLGNEGGQDAMLLPQGEDPSRYSRLQAIILKR